MKIESVTFDLPLQVEATGENEWLLLAPFGATVRFEDGSTEPIHVPAGFVTDLASVPRFPGMFLLFGGKARKSAVIHDHLYAVRADREFADAVFYAAMRHEESAWRRAIMWLGVRAGGWVFYLNDKSPEGTRGDQ